MDNKGDVMPDVFPAGPYTTIEISSEFEAPWYIMPFNEYGHCEAPTSQDHLLSVVKDDAYTDIFLFSHEWNNDWHHVFDRYANFLKGYREMLPVLCGLGILYRLKPIQ
jgi:hypothetical protein